MEISWEIEYVGYADLKRDPNQPLFIADGFEFLLICNQRDMDINRIASITILKDAASTATTLGSKSSQLGSRCRNRQNHGRKTDGQL